ncbi:MAG: 16S rRNA (adenine(1518)-N(6)/adenine(1519)-N(6))-dimethyltransferase RsmA [Anaerolineales bacterium]|nr:16S rRNA (adenine(1518)-N(6)/adenine(1519)-N(6))-dimethyltransferase RsmA [Anaerolineales bacterium]
MSENIQPINISALMEKYQLKPQKSLGQNFLVDPQALQRIVEVADLDPASVVLEIGAGLGHLTRYLAAKAKRVIALEVDKNLIPPLREVLQPYPRVRIVHGDILQLTPGELIDQDNYLVVANIPYYITSKIIRNLLEAENKPQRMVLTVQYEVAQRICAAAGDMSILALSVQIYGEPYLTSRIPAAAFHPPPRVDSASIRIDIYPRPLLSKSGREDYFKLIKAGFRHKRKTLRNSLSAGLGWKKDRTETLLRSAGIDPQRRAETLSLPDWLNITEKYRKL